MEVKAFLKSVFKFCLPSVFSALVGILVIPIVSRFYPTEEYGKINLFYSMGSIIMSLFLLGWDNAYIRFFHEPMRSINSRQMFGMSVAVVAMTAVTTTAVAYFVFPEQILSYLFDETQRKWLILLLALYSASQSVLRMQILKSRLEMNAVGYNVRQMLMLFATRLSFVAALFISTSFIPAVVIMTLATTVLSLGIAVFSRDTISMRFSGVKKADVSAVFRFALPTMPNAVITYLNNTISKMVLSGFGAFAAVGIISVASSVSNLFSLIPTAFAIYWSAYMYKNYDKQQAWICKVHDWICILSIVIVLGIYILQDVLYAIVGGEYQASQPYFMIMMLMPIQSLLTETTSYGITIAKKTQHALFISVLTCGMNLLISMLLVPTMNDLGAALGTGVSAVFCMVAKTVMGQKYYVSITNWKKTAGGIVLIIAVCFLNLITYQSVGSRVICGLLILAASVAVYFKDISQGISALVNLKKAKTDQ